MSYNCLGYWCPFEAHLSAVSLEAAVKAELVCDLDTR